MARPTSTLQPRGSIALMSSTVALAFWRLRQSWFMLLITNAGVVASIMLVCILPLFTQISTTAGLRSVITATPENPYITLHANMRDSSTNNFNALAPYLTGPFDSALNTYISGPPDISIQASDLPLLSPHLLAGGDVRFVGSALDTARAHVKLIRGRLPSTCTSSPCPATLEVAITPETASDLNIDIGSNLTILLPFYKNAPGLPGDPTIARQASLRVAGIIVPNAGNDGFWHYNDLNKIVRNKLPTLYQMLGSNDWLLSLLTQTASQVGADGLFLVNALDVFWYYHLDASRISINQVDDLRRQIDQLKTQLSSSWTDYNQYNPPYVAGTFMVGPLVGGQEVSSPLERFIGRLAIVQIPVAILTLQILLLVLFFISMMAELLVERQSNAIAILRSRGASRQQIFGALTTQGLGLGLVALIVGPVLAIALVYLIAQQMLPPQDQSALNVISQNPLQAIVGVREYVLVAAAVAFAAMAFSIYRATGRDVLNMRRESARSTLRPFWQRLNLDVCAAIIALTSYGASEYVINSGELDPRTDVLISVPLNLIAPLFLVIAGMLLLLRFFPLLLRQGASLAIHGRGAAPMLALAQMGRSPGQFVRMTLLLSFAIAFTFFTLVFTASQNQRTLDVAAYQVGADFSGDLANITVNPASFGKQAALYRRIPGVLSASAGYLDEVSTRKTPLAVRLEAVDPATFVQTAIWTAQDSQQTLSTLMDQLVAQRVGPDAGPSTPIPAIVDDALWNALALSPGVRFSLDAPGRGSLPYVAIARIQDIPTMKSSRILPAAILVDYASYASVYTRTNHSAPPVNHIWLRAQNDATSLTNIRSALNGGTLQLSPLYDRYAIIDSLQSDPLYLALLGILSIGAFTTLVLALVSNLLSSWLNARTRLTSFTILRALGTAPAQVTGVVLWEQCIIYASSLILGIVFGLFLVFTVTPSLIFTSISDNGLTSQTSDTAFFDLQRLLPTHIVFPFLLGLILIILVLICSAAVSLMMRTVSRLSISQVLRLNED